jgi:hypothetical protein
MHARRIAVSPSRSSPIADRPTLIPRENKTTRVAVMRLSIREAETDRFGAILFRKRALARRMDNRPASRLLNGIGS